MRALGQYAIQPVTAHHRHRIDQLLGIGVVGAIEDGFCLVKGHEFTLEHHGGAVGDAHAVTDHEDDVLGLGVAERGAQVDDLEIPGGDDGLAVGELGGADGEFGGGVGFSTNGSEEQKYEVRKTMIQKSLKQQFNPEFLNRIDDIILFNALNEETLKKIITIELSKLNNRLTDKGYKIM